MIIKLDSYRKISNNTTGETAASRRLFGNTVPKLSMQEIEDDARLNFGPLLPENFDGFNARDFIVNAYALATQI